MFGVFGQRHPLSEKLTREETDKMDQKDHTGIHQKLL
jgi:hypothetical protein